MVAVVDSDVGTVVVVDLRGFRWTDKKTETMMVGINWIILCSGMKKPTVGGIPTRRRK